MNDSTLTQLKIIVERAVRPVRASTSWKRKIREELLAHVTGVFEEEAKLGDQKAALARTQERFGQAAEVTVQLQATVPHGDYCGRAVEYLATLRPGESTLRRATRNALMMFLLFGALILPALLVQNRTREWPAIPAVAILCFCFTFLSHWMREALYGSSDRSWIRAVLVGGAAAILIPGATFGVCRILTGEASASVMNIFLPDRIGIPLMPWAMLLTWVPLAVFAYLTEKSLRYRREWDSLPIS